MIKELFGNELVDAVSEGLNDIVNAACVYSGHPGAVEFQTYQEKEEYFEEKGLTIAIIDEGKPGCFGVIIYDLENTKILAVSRLKTTFSGDEVEIEGRSLKDEALVKVNKDFEGFMEFLNQ